MNWDQIRTVAESPKSYAIHWKAASCGQVIGYLCSYVPEEIITATGALPYRILPDPNPFIVKADAHLQTFCCGMARGVLEEALAGELNFLNGVVFPHTCDSIQRLSDIWRINIDFAFHTDFLVPAKLNTKSSHDYLKNIFLKFKAQIESYTGTQITNERLESAVRAHNTLRHLLGRLYALSTRHPKVMNTKDVYALFKAAMAMDRFELVSFLEELLPELEKNTQENSSLKKRLVLSGTTCNLPDIYSLLSFCGADVVWDDLCTGMRYFEGMVAEDKDIIEAIADRYISRSICPAKHAGITRRGEYLVKAVEQNQADGVIFLRLKFCDPHAFDYPYLRDML
ncbi:MAG: 2-hydroxyacyl-CoA dehydratase family protein, partial [Desulfobacteraceae bacterium]